MKTSQTSAHKQAAHGGNTMSQTLQTQADGYPNINSKTTLANLIAF